MRPVIHRIPHIIVSFCCYWSNCQRQPIIMNCIGKHPFRVRLHRAPPLPVRVGDVGARVVPLAVELEGEHARPPDHRFRVRARHRRAARLAPSTAGPVTTSPVTTSPVTTGPVTAGPVAAGAVTAGPVATSVERKLHKVARLHIHPYRVTYRSRGFHTEIFNRHGTVCTCSMQNIDNDTQLVGRFLHKDSVPLPDWQFYGTGNLSAATTVFTNTLYSIDVHYNFAHIVFVNGTHPVKFKCFVAGK